MMVAIVFIIVTIVVETSLFIIKQNRDDNEKRKLLKSSNPLRDGPYQRVDIAKSNIAAHTSVTH